MKERATEATVYVLSWALAGGASHVLYGRLYGNRRNGIAYDAEKALVGAVLSVAATVTASVVVRRFL